jgi:hypothetical protein
MKNVCVGADRCVSPHGLTLLLSISLARWMPHVRAEVAGIHWYNNSMVATLSSPGPRVQHSTAPRVDAFTFDVSGHVNGYKMPV